MEAITIHHDNNHDTKDFTLLVRQALQAPMRHMQAVLDQTANLLVHGPYLVPLLYRDVFGGSLGQDEIPEGWHLHAPPDHPLYMLRTSVPQINNNRS